MKNILKNGVSGFLCILFLFGCNGSGNETSSTNSNHQEPSQQDAVIVSDGFSVVKPDTESLVNIEDNIISPVKGLKLLRVTARDSACGAPVPKGLGFTVYNINGSLCSYDFEVGYENQPNSKSEKYSATTTVLATTNNDPLLPTISQVLSVNSSETIDLALRLGDLVTPTAQIESVELQSDSESSRGTIAKTEKEALKLSYTAPSIPGWNRILYTIKITESSGTTTYKMGSIYITVAEKANAQIVITPIEYDLLEKNPDLSITADSNTEVDLSTLKNLAITKDGAAFSDYQLVAIYSYTATVDLVDKENILNKKFYFKGKGGVAHDITYIIGDHYGSYAVGQMRVNIAGTVVTPRYWKDYKIDEQTYTAPEVYSEAVKEFESVKPHYDFNVNNIVAKYTQADATSYCLRSGRLPTVTDINNLRDKHHPANNASNLWPIEIPYIVTDGNQTKPSYKLYNLQKGTQKPLESKDLGYVTCVSNLPFVVKTISNSFLADSKTHGAIYVESDVAFKKIEVKSNDTNVTVSYTGPIKLSSGKFQYTASVKSSKSSTFHLVVTADNYTYTTGKMYFSGLPSNYSHLEYVLLPTPIEYTQLDPTENTIYEVLSPTYGANLYSKRYFDVLFADPNKPFEVKIRAVDKDGNYLANYITDDISVKDLEFDWGYMEILKGSSNGEPYGTPPQFSSISECKREGYSNIIGDGEYRAWALMSTPLSIPKDKWGVHTRRALNTYRFYEKNGYSLCKSKRMTFKTNNEGVIVLKFNPTFKLKQYFQNKILSISINNDNTDLSYRRIVQIVPKEQSLNGYPYFCSHGHATPQDDGSCKDKGAVKILLTHAASLSRIGFKWNDLSNRSYINGWFFLTRRNFYYTDDYMRTDAARYLKIDAGTEDERYVELPFFDDYRNYIKTRNGIFTPPYNNKKLYETVADICGFYQKVMEKHGFKGKIVPLKLDTVLYTDTAGIEYNFLSKNIPDGTLNAIFKQDEGEIYSISPEWYYGLHHITKRALKTDYNSNNGFVVDGFVYGGSYMRYAPANATCIVKDK